MPHHPARTGPSLSLRLAAEALGTFLFLFFGFNAIAVASDLGDGAITTLGTPCPRAQASTSSGAGRAKRC
jgi:glycerol uptake facilitator-like aquaporin